MLRQVKFKIYHHDCWDTISSDKFKQLEINNISPFVVLKETEKGNVYQALRKVEGPENQVIEFLDYLKNRKDVLDLHIIDKTPDKTIFFVKPKQLSSTHFTLLQNQAVFLEQPKTMGGYEVLNVLVQDSSQMTKLFGELDEIGELKVQKIGKYKGTESAFSLTDKQKAALRTAIAHGYYQHPRESTVEELASISGISRSTFQEHLRKAESKIIKRAAEGVIK